MKKLELYKIIHEAIDETVEECPAPTQDVLIVLLLIFQKEC